MKKEWYSAPVLICAMAGISIGFLIATVTVDPCNNRYRNLGSPTSGGGEEITMENAERWANEFKSHYGWDSCAFYFSKNAVDQIFRNNERYNGLVLYLGRDDSEVPRMIMMGTTRSNQKLVTFPSASTTNIFLSRCYCPLCCGAVVYP